MLNSDCSTHALIFLLRSDRTEGNDHIGAEQSECKCRKMRQIGAEREHHGEREEPFQKRKEKRSENIRSESEKISVEKSGASSVVQKDA